MLLSACCLLPTHCQARDHIEEIGFLFDGVVETLSGPLSFRRNPSIDFGIRSGMAMGV